MKRLMQKTAEAVLGLVVLIVIGAVAVNFLGGAAQRQAEEKAMAADLTLADYAGLAPEERRMRVAAAAAAAEAPDRIDDFIDCMGEFAATKNPELAFAEVFGWCDLERANHPNVFAAHVDELEAKDLSMEALTICQAMVKNGLVSPASAKFSFVEPIARGRQRYLIASHVDAQKFSGATLRVRFVCEIQHDGGDPLAVANWTTHQLEVEPQAY